MRFIRLTLVLCVIHGGGALTSGQEPGWASEVVAAPQVRPQIEATPIVERPYRPFHFYGNTVRRRYYRGTALPAPSDFRQGAAVLARRPYVPVDRYLRRGL